MVTFLVQFGEARNISTAQGSPLQIPVSFLSHALSEHFILYVVSWKVQRKLSVNFVHSI